MSPGVQMPGIGDRLFAVLNEAENEGPTAVQDEQPRTFNGPLSQGVTEGTGAPGVDVVPDGDDSLTDYEREKEASIAEENEALERLDRE